MSQPSSAQITEQLSGSLLLTPAQRLELVQGLGRQYPDSRGLAQQLLQRGWLTAYQLNQLFLGRAADLVLGPYVVLERLGEGGTGQVFKARHQHMNRVVALKMIRKEVLADPEAVGRFQREIHAISQLSHPNIIHAYDAGPIGPNFFLAMELVEGTDLQRLVKEGGPLSVPQAIGFMRQAAAGLQYIHERGLIHRDIKPSNLLVANGAGTIKILDLGLARLRRTIDHDLTGNLTQNKSVMMGTMDFMAPEQAMDFHAADRRADIYSLGCTFYFLLTGRAPFEGGSAAQVLLAHQQKEAAPLEQHRRDVPPGLTAVLRRMMAKRPDGRYQMPGDLERELLKLGPPVAELLPVPSLPRQGALVPVASPVPRALMIVAENEPSSPGRILPACRRLWGLARRQGRRRLLLAGLGGALMLGLLVWLIAGTEEKHYVTDLPETQVVARVFSKNGVSDKGERLAIGNRLAPKGLYFYHPFPTPAHITYKLNKQYKRFRATVGLPDRVGDTGGPPRVTFVVQGDDKVLWESKPIERPGNYQDCDVSVAGVDRLQLVIIFAGNSYHAHGVWADPYVTK